MADSEKVKVCKMSDDVIAIIRELVQLSLLTGTNIVDHLRAVVMEHDTETGTLVPTEEYVEAYDRMIADLNEQAKQAQEAYMQAQMEAATAPAGDEPVEPPPGDGEVN